MDRAKYLQRIGVDGRGVAPDLESLRRLQRRHLLAVPFENLDIHWHRPISLDVERFYTKVVEECRGGFCYELNGLFIELLDSLGFTARLISARVGRPDGSFGAEYDHATIIVSIAGEEFLTDVGFGDFSAEPLRFVVSEEQQDANGTFKIEPADSAAFVVKKLAGDEWKNEYLFTAMARDLEEFAEMCHYHQTSPSSSFTKGKLCSLMTENGRKTLTDETFIVSENGDRQELDVASDNEFQSLLRTEFGIGSSKGLRKKLTDMYYIL